MGQARINFQKAQGKAWYSRQKRVPGPISSISSHIRSVKVFIDECVDWPMPRTALFAVTINQHFPGFALKFSGYLPA